MGIGAKLASIMDSPLGHSSPEITLALIQITNSYLKLELLFLKNSEVCEVGGVHIAGIESN